MEDKGWVPRTELGKKVLEGSITSLKEIMEKGLPILETGIIDRLLPSLDSEILEIGRVQRRDRSGRKLRYRVTVAVGNRDGYVGIGQGKAKEVYNSIQKAIEDGKKNLICVRRGCGSWECGCGKPHSVPFKVVGKSGSVEVTLMPAPRGVHLAAGDVAKTVLELAGIEDVWSRVEGDSRTTLNFATAAFNALRTTNAVQAGAEDMKKLGVALAEIKQVQVAAAPVPPKLEVVEVVKEVVKELKKEGLEAEVEVPLLEAEESEEEEAEPEEPEAEGEAEQKGEPGAEASEERGEEGPEAEHEEEGEEESKPGV